jgi:hypothetical protein
MMDWETLYRRLVTRLEQIAKEGEQQSLASHLRLIEYDKVARAHARTAADTLRLSKEALLAAEGAG